jgi:DnaJ-class molecular chaperone
MTNRTIPCPKCGGSKEPSRGDDKRGRDSCGRCRGRGTIPDRRTPTASDRAVERIKAEFGSVYGSGFVSKIMDIIREEEGRD